MRAAVLALVFVAGCTGPEVSRLTAKRAEFLEAYVQGVDLTVDGLLAWGKSKALAESAARASLALEEETKTARLYVGDDPEGAPIWAETEIVKPDIAKRILKSAGEKALAIDGEVSLFRSEWAEVAKNYEDAVEVDRRIRSVLESSEVLSPEQIDALSDALAREIRRR